MARSHRPAAVPALLIAAGIVATACGSTPSQGSAPWAAAHPEPSGMHFTDAQGLCAITVRYPDEAPGEIDYKGAQYIQRTRTSNSAGASGTVVATSGDWTVRQPTDDTLLVVTPDATFEYRSGANCGSNSAAPT